DAVLAPGHTALIVMPQSAELLCAVTGCVMRGVIPSVLPFPNVKFHPERYREQLRHLVQYLDAQLVVGSRQIAPSAAALVAEVVAASSGCRYLNWEDLELHPASAPLFRFRDDDGAIVVLQHSSGTTGLQKGIV